MIGEPLLCPDPSHGPAPATWLVRNWQGRRAPEPVDSYHCDECIAVLFRSGLVPRPGVLSYDLLDPADRKLADLGPTDGGL